jgi:uncharacterized peroxidase-related enzyme
VGLAITTYDAATGPLREIYDRMRERALPPVYRPAHGGMPGIIAMHSLDPQLIPKVFGAASTLNDAGPLSWPERELVNAITSRLNQCLYSTASHAEFLRVALEEDALAQAVIAEPRAIAQSWPNLRLRMIAELAITVTEAPWTLSRQHLQRAHKAGLSAEDILHVITLSSYFGHLNRIANAVQGPLDYTVKLAVPQPDPTVPPWPTAPELLVGRPAIDIARRPATANAFTEWRHYIFYSHDTPLTRRQRTLIARWVATWIGDGGISPPTDLTVNPVDDALRGVAEVVTLAPWQLDDATYTPLRERGFDEAGVFDVCATATSAGVFSRIEVALVALAR